MFHAQWPECDEEAMKDDEIEVAKRMRKQRQPLNLYSLFEQIDIVLDGFVSTLNKFIIPPNSRL